MQVRANVILAVNGGILMTTWAYHWICREHDLRACDCDPVIKYSLWRLTDDEGNDVASVQQFHKDAPYYGNTRYGRTGSMTELVKCQAACELMLKRQKGPLQK